MLKKLALLLALTGVCAIALPGCGGKDDGGTPDAASDAADKAGDAAGDAADKAKDAAGAATKPGG